MRRALVMACLAAVLVAAPVAARLDSGVRGTVTVGPTTPVCMVDTPCSSPYETRVGIRNLRTRRLRHVRSDERGRFSARLRAGRYRIRPAGGDPLPHCSPVTVRVRRHRFKRVSIECDSGIR